MTSESTSSELAHRKSVTAHQKVKAALRLLAGESAEELARELEVSEARVLRWKHSFVEGGRANLLQRREHKSTRWHARRKKLVQWASLVVGLVVVIWAVTRLVGRAPGGD